MTFNTGELYLDGVPTTYETLHASGGVWKVFERQIEGFARALSCDGDSRDDLVLEAMIALWKADVTRYDFSNRDHVAYLRRTLINRMCTVWGKGSDEVKVDEAELRCALAALTS
jgi:DNA-directed RNA polymerase specialized sigma24 family protein